MEGNPFYKNKKKVDRPENNIGGSFRCQHCNKKTDGAFYDIEESALIWWCSDDHMSVIEEYRLG